MLNKAFRDMTEAELREIATTNRFGVTNVWAAMDELERRLQPSDNPPQSGSSLDGE